LLSPRVFFRGKSRRRRRSDFSPDHERLLAERNVDLRGLERREGKTFRWHGRYHEDMNKRDTLGLELNVFADSYRISCPISAAPIISSSPTSRRAPGTRPHQMTSPKIVAADTMNHWIESERNQLIRLLSKIDILTLNDEEARMLAANKPRQGRPCHSPHGPKTVLVKRGEYGVLQFSPESMFRAGLSLEEIVDPTGAGDTFAGGFMASLRAWPDERGGPPHSGRLRHCAGFVRVERFSVDRMLTLTWTKSIGAIAPSSSSRIPSSTMDLSVVVPVSMNARISVPCMRNSPELSKLGPLLRAALHR